MVKPLKMLSGPGWVMTLSLVGLILFFNVWISRHDVRLDLTPEQQFTLSPQTTKMLKRLKAERQEVKVTAFYRSRSAKRQRVENRLRGYFRAAGGQLSYEMVDPELQPGLVEKFRVSLDETLVIESGGGRKEILSADEQALSSAILAVTRKDKPPVYFLQGHGELDLNDSYNRGGLGIAKTQLEQENYAVRPLQLSKTQYKVPDDSSVVVWAGPRQGLLTEERRALQEYLRKGGHLLLLLPPRVASGFEAVLQVHGIRVGHNIVVDPQQNLQEDVTVPLITRFQAHPLTRNLKGTAVFFPLASSIEAAEDSKTNITPLMFSSAKSWGETRLGDDALIQQGPEDPVGPLSLAVAAEIPTSDSTQKARMVVVGNATFISNRFASVLGNRDFFLNSVAWLTGDTGLMDIHPRPPRDTRFFLSGQHLRWAWIIHVILAPGLFFCLGLWLWWRKP